MCRDFFLRYGAAARLLHGAGSLRLPKVGIQSHGLSPRLLHKPAASPGLRRGHALSCSAAPGATCGVSLRSPVSPALFFSNNNRLTRNQLITRNS